MSALARPLGAGFVVLDLLWFVVAFAVVAVVYRAVTSARLRITSRSAVARGATCGSCGWMGSVSAFAPRCPTCNARLDQAVSR